MYTVVVILPFTLSSPSPSLPPPALTHVESEELLSKISSSHFIHTALSLDLSQLLVSTHNSHLLLISLPDYFQLFPNHYHPRFISEFVRKTEVFKSATKSSNITKEEDENRLKYGGLSDKHYGTKETFIGPYRGHFSWENRKSRLQQSVQLCQPSKGQCLNLRHCSQHPPPMSVPTYKAGQRQQEEAQTDLEAVEVLKQPWYKEPVSQSYASSSRNDFDIQFVTGMTKPVLQLEISSSSHATGTDSPTPTRYSYTNHCILPSVANALDSDSTVTHIAFSSGVIVAYYGRGGAQLTVGDSPVISGPAVLDQRSVTGIAVYHRETQSYSITRYMYMYTLVGVSVSEPLSNVVLWKFVCLLLCKVCYAVCMYVYVPVYTRAWKLRAAYFMLRVRRTCCNRAKCGYG